MIYMDRILTGICFVGLVMVNWKFLFFSVSVAVIQE